MGAKAQRASKYDYAVTAPKSVQNDKRKSTSYALSIEHALAIVAHHDELCALLRIAAKTVAEFLITQTISLWKWQSHSGAATKQAQMARPAALAFYLALPATTSG